MKNRMLAMAVMMAIVAGTSFARNIEIAATAEITVCTEKTAHDLPMLQARALASRMFATAGVTILWHGVNHCPVDGIQISLSEMTKPANHPGALAYALPYEGTHIVVFWDRIQDLPDDGAVAHLLAHVLVHEVTHILQGVDRHSETGIMKAQYTALDIRQMEGHPLAFTALDIELIQFGIRDRLAAAAAHAQTEVE